MRIGIISIMHDFSWGGSETLWADMALAALNERHEVFLSVYKWDPLAPNILNLQAKGANIHLRERMHPLSIFERIKLKFRSKNYNEYSDFFVNKMDILIINDGGTFGFLKYNALLNKLSDFGGSIFFISQFNFDWGVSLKDKYLEAREHFLRFRGVFFVSDRNRLTAERELAMKLPYASIIRNPVNLANIDLVPYPSSTQPVSFASVARLDCDFKGQDILFEVLGDPVWRSRNWVLNIYGQGPDMSYLKDLASFYNISEKLIFHGHVNDIRTVWLKNHILLLPSIGEGIPLALAEAMLCGRPSVVTDVGGNTEWIEDGNNGYVAEAPLKKYFESAMERAWNHLDEWEKIGNSARLTALQKISFNAGKALLDEMLNKI
jgi:glycosyltransferase involved in cell wall biosynthesis